LACVAEISRHDAAAIAVVVGTAEIAEIQKCRSMLVHPQTLALIHAEVVAPIDDVPGILAPELLEGVIQFPGKRNAGRAIARL
jgi:hypothetical protein